MLVCRNFVLKETLGMTKTALSMSTFSGVEKSRVMQKLLNKKGGKSKKKQWYKPHLGEPLELASKKTKKGISVAHSIRLQQHSHVLYDKITEIINTGELSDDIMGKQVSITSVKVQRDMSGLHVTWDADRKDAKEVEELLQANSGKLRSLLISYHILGRIPHIVFVKDKTKADLSELTRLLAEADYRPGYQPGTNQSGIPEEIQYNLVPELITSYPSEVEEVSPHRSKSEKSSISINTHGESSDSDSNSNHDYFSYLLDKNLSIGANTCEESDMIESVSSHEELSFRSDLYGLNRDEIVQKIQAKRKRWIPSEAVEAQLPLTASLNSGKVSPTFAPMDKKMKERHQNDRRARKMKEKMLERNFSDSDSE